MFWTAVDPVLPSVCPLALSPARRHHAPPSNPFDVRARHGGQGSMVVQMNVQNPTRLECLRGKDSWYCDAGDLMTLARGYAAVLLDLGTGDGRYARALARTHPDWLAIGVDACREGLRGRSRVASVGDNALFVIANALALPSGLTGLATRLAINFPWGSLLPGLLDGDQGLLDGLCTDTRPGAILECRLNGGALAEVGRTLDDGAAQARRMLRAAGFVPDAPLILDAQALRDSPGISYPGGWEVGGCR